ncbi:ASCH domain-containing protein [Thermoanaerobacterium thermosaccharolyticum]|uniref:ASCH domain-containing protein n=1 Tax=Thermoanaerobacterium thermosaccharolyticum TaxID=1517 RepID=UPI003DA7D679
MDYMCLSVRQPFASAIVWCEKTIEIRSWKTDYRGPLVICSSGRDFKAKYDDGTSEILPGGYALGVVNLTNIRPLKISDGDAAWFEREDWNDLKGQYAWILEDCTN